MLRKLMANKQLIKLIRRYSEKSLVKANENVDKIQILPKTNIDLIDNLNVEPVPKQSVLDECKEDISHVAPYLKPTFNFAAYANNSETIQELVKLGVKLWKFEKNPEIPPFILRLDFEKDIKHRVLYFYDLGLNKEDIGHLITKNPFILKEEISNMEIRINYLKYKKFDHAMIMRIIQKNALWLSYSTQEIDERLGFFQKQFELTGNEVRMIAVKRPTLITYNLGSVKLNYFAVREEMGFLPEQIKQILLDSPVIFTKNKDFLVKTFEYLHNKMGISHETIIATSGCLTCRLIRLKERHSFLKELKRNQYDPKKTNYISLKSVITGTDVDFAVDVAKSSIQIYNDFLKTL